MKTVFKWLGYGVGGFVALVAVAAILVYALSAARFRKVYHVNVQPVPVATEPEALKRGHHIAQTRGCLDCHGKDLGGAKIVDDPAIGRWHGPNLTRGVGGVPVEFGAIDFVRSIRHGVSPAGRPYMLMPSHEFARFSDRDMSDLVAYLQSVPPVDRARVPLTVGPVARALIVAGKMVIPAEQIDHAGVRPDNVTPGASVEYGRYLSAGCMGCHGTNFSGGKIPGAPPDWPLAADLRPQAGSAVAKWTEADFFKAMREGKRPNGTEINRVMPWPAFGHMHDDELKAVWLYLRSLPENRN